MKRNKKYKSILNNAKRAHGIEKEDLNLNKVDIN